MWGMARTLDIGYFFRMTCSDTTHAEKISDSPNPVFPGRILEKPALLACLQLSLIAGHARGTVCAFNSGDYR